MPLNSETLAWQALTLKHLAKRRMHAEYAEPSPDLRRVLGHCTLYYNAMSIVQAAMRGEYRMEEKVVAEVEIEEANVADNEIEITRSDIEEECITTAQMSAVVDQPPETQMTPSELLDNVNSVEHEFEELIKEIELLPVMDGDSSDDDCDDDVKSSVHFAPVIRYNRSLKASMINIAPTNLTTISQHIGGDVVINIGEFSTENALTESNMNRGVMIRRLANQLFKVFEALKLKAALTEFVNEEDTVEASACSDKAWAYYDPNSQGAIVTCWSNPNVDTWIICEGVT